jgi:hypothetical protein
MKKKWVLIGLILLLVVAQAFQPSLNRGTATGPGDIMGVVSVPADVSGILKQSCYDCHSNHTTYPWYDRIAPVSWWVADHIKDGKNELNFTEFATYSPKKQRHKLEEIRETVEAGAMPLKSYLIMHGDAKLTDAQKSRIAEWTRQAEAGIRLPGE